MNHKTKPQTTKSINRRLVSLLLRDKSPAKLSRHCIATLIVDEPSKLFDSKSFTDQVKKLLKAESVQCIGEVTYEFYNKSFTSVLALAESHISVHTWPERHAVQLDVFLCSYMNDNTEKCQRIFDEIINYFDPIEVERTYVERL